MEIDRFDRQRLLPQIGAAKQEKLRRARVLLIGCGALGGVMAEQLVRGGVGWLRLVDRDLVEWSNLQRQVLFEESDAKQSLPKAVAAANRLRAIDSAAKVDARIVDVHSENVESLMRVEDRFVDLVLDGTDNVQTRYLLNDAAVKHAVPWIYGGCVGVEGRVMGVIPGATPCLRCIFPEPPNAGELPTCDTAGVLGSAAAIVASFQVAAAIRFLVSGEMPATLLRLNAWTSQLATIDTSVGRRADCPTCGKRQFEFLDALSKSDAMLCGRDAVQISAAPGEFKSLNVLRDRLIAVMEVEQTPYFLKCRDRNESSIVLTIFADGRAIVQGTRDLGRARAIYARYVGM